MKKLIGIVVLVGMPFLVACPIDIPVPDVVMTNDTLAGEIATADTVAGGDVVTSETTSDDPCSKNLNPQCEPKDCKSATGEQGTCKFDAAGACGCVKTVVPTDPCYKELNPNCEPKDCKFATGEQGTCKFDAAGACGCVKTVVPTDPCSDALNPKCEPIKCALTTPAGAYVDALCALDPATKTCTCGGGLVNEDPCSDALNPNCEPKDCKLATGEVGTCKFNANKVCGCQPAVPDGWCVPCKSAADCPTGTTCSDDDNNPATQTVCTMVYTPAVGCPTGLYGDYTVSKYCICP